MITTSSTPILVDHLTQPLINPSLSMRRLGLQPTLKPTKSSLVLSIQTTENHMYQTLAFVHLIDTILTMEFLLILSPTVLLQSTLPRAHLSVHTHVLLFLESLILSQVKHLTLPQTHLYLTDLTLSQEDLSIQMESHTQSMRRQETHTTLLPTRSSQGSSTRMVTQSTQKQKNQSSVLNHQRQETLRITTFQEDSFKYLLTPRATSTTTGLKTSSIDLSDQKASVTSEIQRYPFQN